MKATSRGTIFSFRSRSDTSQPRRKSYALLDQIYILLTNVYPIIETDDAAHEQSIFDTRSWFASFVYFFFCPVRSWKHDGWWWSGLGLQPQLLKAFLRSISIFSGRKRICWERGLTAMWNADVCWNPLSGISDDFEVSVWVCLELRWIIFRLSLSRQFSTVRWRKLCQNTRANNSNPLKHSFSTSIFPQKTRWVAFDDEIFAGRFQIARIKEILAKINCRKLTNKVVNRKFSLVCQQWHKSLICHAVSEPTKKGGNKAEKENSQERYFSNRKLLDNLVIIEMVVSFALFISFAVASL